MRVHEDQRVWLGRHSITPTPETDIQNKIAAKIFLKDCTKKYILKDCESYNK